MFRSLILFGFILASFSSIAQDTSLQSEEIASLKKKIQEIEEIQNENSDILKRQLADQYFDQSSRGYIELKLGGSLFNPKDIEDRNDELFNELDDANWEKFGYAVLLDLEIGKTIQDSESTRHEVGIGYQQLRSGIEGNFTPNGGGGKIKVFETVSMHTLFARYTRLFKADQSGQMYIGPGVTLGYSPVSKIMIQLEQGNEGAQVSGEGTSYLVEVFGKAKYELSRYFSLIAISGFRLQRAENLRLTAAELISLKTKADVDASGLYAALGLAVAF